MKYHTFLPRFHPLILSGQKTTTFRGSTRVRDGEDFAARCWTARPYGSPMGWLGVCRSASVLPAAIRPNSLSLAAETITSAAILDVLARLDGFADWSEMIAHFGERLPFKGVRIAWARFIPGKPEAA